MFEIRTAPAAFTLGARLRALKAGFSL